MRFVVQRLGTLIMLVRSLVQNLTDEEKIFFFTSIHPKESIKYKNKA